MVHTNILSTKQLFCYWKLSFFRLELHVSYDWPATTPNCFLTCVLHNLIPILAWLSKLLQLAVQSQTCMCVLQAATNLLAACCVRLKFLKVVQSNRECYCLRVTFRHPQHNTYSLYSEVSYCDQQSSMNMMCLKVSFLTFETTKTKSTSFCKTSLQAGRDLQKVQKPRQG